MEFFIIMNDQQQGPFTLEQMSNLNIMADTPVWHEGLSDWTTAENVKELSHLVAYAPRVGDNASAPPNTATISQPPTWTPRPPAGPAPEYSTSVNYDTPALNKPRKSRTSLWVTLAIVALLAIILAATNPNKEDHCRAVTKVSHTWANETIEDLGGTGIIGGIVKLGSTQIIRSIVDNVVDVENYGVFSLGYIDTGADKTRVSLGILGHVFTFDKNIIDQKLKEAMGNDFKEKFRNLINIDDLFSSDDNENDLVTPYNPEDSDEVVSPEDRAESIFDLPPEVDTLMKKGARKLAKEGIRQAEKAIDELLK
ncbi:MAG: DUF4339 domain-containing protein [Muribaculaceae bacterium]|nr:DUF4339 domain-containing protein [Muribaculaceae bacterium]